jgi:outer membrane protein
MAKRCAKGWVPGAAGAVLWILAGMGAAAQEVDVSRPLTVDDCVRVALGESPVIGEAEARLKQADGTAQMAWRAVLPTVDASAGWGGYTSSEERVQVVNGILVSGKTIYSGSLGVTARQPILDLDSFQQMRGAWASQSAVEYDVSETRSNVRETVSTTFYGCVAAVLLAGVEDNAVAVTREQLRRAETLFNLGSVARSDVLQAKVNLADADLNAIDRHNTVRVASARLAMQMGVDPQLDLVVDTTLVIPAVDPGRTIEEWVGVAHEARPDLRAARDRLRAAELSEQASRLAYLPTLGASADWSRSANSLTEKTFQGVPKTSTWSVGVGLSLTLFDGLAREGRMQTATGARRGAQESLDQLTQNAALEVKDAFLSIAKNRESLRAAREGVQLAAESLRLQQALYESGAGTLLEWDNARLGLRRAQVSLIQAEISLLLSHLRFHTAIGE